MIVDPSGGDIGMAEPFLHLGDVGLVIDPDMIYKLVQKYSAELGFEIGAHALRATAATNALGNVGKAEAGLPGQSSSMKNTLI